MSDDNRAMWNRIDEHSQVINQLQISQAAAKADTDARLLHLEQGQARQLEIMTRIEHKIDGNTESLNQAQGGIRLGKWIAGLSVSIIGLWIAFVKFWHGG